MPNATKADFDKSFSPPLFKFSSKKEAGTPFVLAVCYLQHKRTHVCVNTLNLTNSLVSQERELQRKNPVYFPVCSFNHSETEKLLS